MSSAAARVAPPPPRRLGTNIGFGTFGRVYYAVSQLVILLVLTRLGTAQDVGAFTLASSIVTPMFFLASMGLREVHTVDDLTRFGVADYIALRLYSSAFAFLLCVGLAAAFYADTQLVLLSMIAFALVKFFGAQVSLNHGIFQRVERLDYVALSNVGRATAGAATFGAVFWWTRSLPLALLLEAVCWALSNIAVDRTLLRRIDAWTPLGRILRVPPRTVLRLALWVLPIGLTLWFIRASISAPVVLLDQYADLAEVGVFGVILYLYSALSMLANSVGSASSARLRRHVRAGDRARFARTVRALLAATAALGLVIPGGAWLAGEPVLALVFGAAYARGDLLVLVMLAGTLGMVSAPAVAAINALQAFRARLFTAVCCFAVAALAAAWLVPGGLAVGAARALVLMAACYTTLNLALLTRAMTRHDWQPVGHGATHGATR